MSDIVPESLQLPSTQGYLVKLLRSQNDNANRAVEVDDVRRRRLAPVSLPLRRRVRKVRRGNRRLPRPLTEHIK
jgi:hypothetical protein